MIIDNRTGSSILESGEKHIAFPVTTEGYNYSGVAGEISRKYWHELKEIGDTKAEGFKAGTVLQKEVEGVTYYALVCYSIKKGWVNSADTICKCFNSIGTTEPIAADFGVATDFAGKFLKANLKEINKGMENSDKRIILY